MPGLTASNHSEVGEIEIHGDVDVLVTVDEHGSDSRASVERSAHVILDGAALEAVWRMSFASATKDGVPVPAEATVSFKFRIL